MVVEKL